MSTIIAYIPYTIVHCDLSFHVNWGDFAFSSKSLAKAHLALMEERLEPYGYDSDALILPVKQLPYYWQLIEKADDLDLVDYCAFFDSKRKLLDKSKVWWTKDYPFRDEYAASKSIDWNFAYEE